MSKSSIEWTDYSFNPWWGCTEVSPACVNCYARSHARRFINKLGVWFGGVRWGAGEPRHLAPDHLWEEPRKWNRQAAKAGVRARVFCASMADVFDNEAPQAWRTRLWQLIDETPYLDWLLLSKRIGNARRMLPKRWFFYGFPLNLQLGSTVVTQQEVQRDLPKLKDLPAFRRFLSCEPLLEPLKFEKDYSLRGIHQVIVGQESGRVRRHMDEQWARMIRDQARDANAAFFYKQRVVANVVVSLPLLDGERWAQFPEPVMPGFSRVGQEVLPL